MFRNTGANAFAKNQMRLAYEDKRDLYCMAVVQNTLEIFLADPTDPFDVGRSISDRLQTDVGKDMPRRGGHGLSWPPDSGIGLSSDGRTQGSGVGRFDQSTFWQSISQPHRWKRRAAGRMMTDSGMGLGVMPEGTQRGTPRKRALFGPGCSHSVSPVSIAEARLGGRSRMRIRIWLLREISDSAPALGLGRIYVNDCAHVCG